MRPGLSELVRASATSLPPITDKAFPQHFDFLSRHRIVLLGDSSHGTSEFYAARAAITQRLISHHGFTTVALEADWPDAECLDRYVRQRPGPSTELKEHEPPDAPFERFPTWMWRNREMQEFVHWLRDWNEGQLSTDRAGVFGLDLYSMGSSRDAVTRYLDSVDPVMAETARRRYACLDPWVEDPAEYGIASMMSPKFRSCENEVSSVLQDLLQRRLEYAAAVGNGEEFHSAEQNARLVADAEMYYRSMFYADEKSWNLRDGHMFNSLSRLLKFRTGGVVVWAHNSHLGDARHTDMTKRGELNLGQLCREKYGNQVAILGCGSHDGTVAAAHDWDGDMETMDVVPSRADSWERVAHDTGLDSFVLNIRDAGLHNERLKRKLEEQKMERFIGVIYRPETERQSHYSKAALGKQFDAYLWFDRTGAVRPLEKKQLKTPVGLEETYPFGL
ncbi:hypothetical protein V500_05656 [Pseudogymnoascus sp. VKM F-4518 (FW-2643)]|nr:hypothetical protein V500_05656 [Pseudogymnoascus sp. VKM F-4518 (FW-2643)]